eukprot:2348183-Amphidinium_carterae.1
MRSGFYNCDLHCFALAVKLDRHVHHMDHGHAIPENLSIHQLHDSNNKRLYNTCSIVLDAVLQ